MIGPSRDFVEIVALLLLIGQRGSLVSGSSGRAAELSREMRSKAELDLGLDEPQYEGGNNNQVVIAGHSRDNLKRYLLKDLDLDGYLVSRPNRERWRWFQLKELLETLSSTIPTPAPQPAATSPIYRQGRTSPSKQLAADKRKLYRPAPYLDFDNLKGIKTIQGINYKSIGGEPGGRPSAEGAAILMESSPAAENGLELGGRTHQHRIIYGSEEEVPMAPMRTRSPPGDNEWKRVENLSKWNNLRGMWGKRAMGNSAAAAVQQTQDSIEAPATAVSFHRQLLENQQVL